MDVASEKNNSALALSRAWPGTPTAWPRATMVVYGRQEAWFVALGRVHYQRL